MLSPYRRVLAVPGAFWLFASALIARLPQGMSSLATLLLVRGATHSYAAAGAAVGAEALASAAFVPPLGRLIDRHGRARVLLRCAMAYCAAMWLLVLGAQLRAGSAVLIVLSGLAGALLPPIAPSLRAMLRDVFADVGVRERAYALESISQELIWIVGPMIVAAVIAFLSPAVAVLVLGAQSVAGTIVFTRSPLVRQAAPAAAGERRHGALASRTLRVLLVPVLLMGIALGAIEVGLPALALHTGSRAATGLLLALWSVGSMTGGLMYGSRSWSAPLAARYAALLLVAVACTAPLLVADSLLAGVAGALLAGVTVAPVFSCQYALVGQFVVPGTETEAFTWVSAALVAGLAAGSAAGGGLVAAAGFHAPFALACGAGALAAAFAFVVRALAAGGAPGPVEAAAEHLA
ncbi:MAG TPA: MFS transporter [Solirubrobacteraceae bacterium]|nr:MFS transporter [Solirubrobacteraceae bacterium]